MVKLSSKKTKFSVIPTLVMAIVIIAAPFIVPMIEGKDIEGEDVRALAEAISQINLDHTPVSYAVSSSTPQFVILSFDGSKSLEMLEDTLGFEKKLESEGKPLKFTYFVNAAYFLTEDNKDIYKPPRKKAGESNIGYSNNREDIAKRVEGLNKAVLLGNEVASHAAGHYNGHDWNAEEWRQEFNSFKSIIYNVRPNNNLVDGSNPDFLSAISGFRAPDLGINEDMYQTLKDFHFAYDSSGIGPMDEWPKLDLLGIWHFPIAVIKLGFNQTPVLSMDYSIWVQQSGGRDTASKGSENWQKLYKEVRDAYTDYFNLNYNGGRAPIIIANHFTKMNDGLYFEAMKGFAEEVCGKPYVRCATFKTLVNYLNTYGAPKVRPFLGSKVEP